MKTYALKTKNRLKGEKGKNAAGRLRRQGIVPANLMSKGSSSLLSFLERDFEALVKSGLRSSSLIELDTEKEGKLQVVVKEYQRHPISAKLLHADFYQVEKDKAFLVRIGIEPRGTAKGIKMGGALEHYVRSIQVQTTLEALQEVVEVDISHLEVGQAVYLEDLRLPSAWKVLLDANPIILRIARARVSGTDAAAESTDREEASSAT